MEEVAGVAVMLARNGYITGQTVNVNGGGILVDEEVSIVLEAADEKRHNETN